jgi:hypothetical protein
VLPAEDLRKRPHDMTGLQEHSCAGFGGAEGAASCTVVLVGWLLPSCMHLRSVNLAEQVVFSSCLCGVSSYGM